MDGFQAALEVARDKSARDGVPRILFWHEALGRWERRHLLPPGVRAYFVVTADDCRPAGQDVEDGNRVSAAQHLVDVLAARARALRAQEATAQMGRIREIVRKLRSRDLTIRFSDQLSTEARHPRPYNNKPLGFPATGYQRIER